MSSLMCNPGESAHQGSFVGRIWVEDHDFNIVRFNGTYSNKSNYDSYFHFDSWRMNTQPGIWLPSYIYSEETSRRQGHPPSSSLASKRRPGSGITTKCTLSTFRVHRRPDRHGTRQY